VADAYLFVMLRWAQSFGVPISEQLLEYFRRVAERDTVRRALEEEGLIDEVPSIGQSLAASEMVA